MRKSFALYLLLTPALLLSERANAQVPVSTHEPLVNQYVADSYTQRSTTWWDALGRQLELQLDQPYSEVNSVTLQNIVFFATHHRDKVKLDDAAPRLLEIYLHHEQEEYRVMALAALHAIGERETMRKLTQVYEDQPSERLRRITLAALNDHYH